MEDDFDIACAVFKQAEFRSAHFWISVNPNHGNFHNLVAAKNRPKSRFSVHGKAIVLPWHGPENIGFVEFEVIREIVLADLEECFYNSVKQTIHQTFEKRIAYDFSSFNETGTDHAIAILFFNRIKQRPDLVDVFDKIAVHGQRILSPRVDGAKTGFQSAPDSARRSSPN